MRPVLIFSMLLFLACQENPESKEIKFEGAIGTEVKMNISLQVEGEKVVGELINPSSNQSIPLRGKLVNGFLRLKEFAKHSEITGIMEGTYEDGVYKGVWSSPEGGKDVPFSFEEIKEISISNDDYDLEKSFSNWVQKKNQGSDNFCTAAQCAEEIERMQGGLVPLSECSMSISDVFPEENVVYYDLNKDGVEDAFITAYLEPCMMGTWFINVEMKGYLVVFVSAGNGEYQVLDNPKVLVDNIEIGRIKKVVDDVIFADGGSVSGNSGAHNVDITWTARFSYDNGAFKLISKSAN